MATELEDLMKFDQASIRVNDSNGNLLIENNANLPLVPASTIKLLTAYMALKTWGSDHQFTTEFYQDDNNNLGIRGLGDPFLISEELDLIIKQLKARGLNEIHDLIVDSSFFDSNIIIDGQSNSNNPYDAPLGALAINFNTIHVDVKHHQVKSAEQQTPITPLAIKLSSTLGPGKHRINLGSAELGPQYFAEIFQQKCRQQNIQIHGSIRFRKTPAIDSLFSRPVFYRHHNSHSLEDVISGMLKYSNNFIANQLFLLLGVEAATAPANMQQSIQAFEQFIEDEFGWKNMRITEGAGLSRDNQMSASQLTELLHAMKPYAQLLAEKEDGIIAKTGTLNGIKTYAGYFRNNHGRKNHDLLPFSIMINQPVSWEFRRRVAQQLRIKALQESQKQALF